MSLKSVMNTIYIKIIMIFMGALILAPTSVFAKDKINVYIFTGDGCSHCAEAKSAFENIKGEYGDYFTLVEYETWYNEDNATLMEEVMGKMGDDTQGVPYIIIGNHSWSGYTKSYLSEIEEKIFEEYNSDNRYDVLKEDKSNNNSSSNNDTSSSNAKNESANESTDDNGTTAALLIIVGIGIIVLTIALISKYNKVKNNKKEKEKFNKICIWLSISVFVIFVIILIAVSVEDTNEYLNAKIKGCPSITLKEGLENLKSFYNKYNIDFDYKFKEGESSTGDKYMYLYLYRMEYLYDYNVYTPLELNNDTVSFEYIFRNGTVDRSLVGGAENVEDALCGNYN